LLGALILALCVHFISSGDPLPKQHSTFPITYGDKELARIETALVDLVETVARSEGP
jgi:hypothetical protein